MTDRNENYDYDVCLSFAGEDREYVESVADRARKLGLRVFYDMYEEIELWGKDLYEHLDDVYKNMGKYCVVFISSSYATKLWTNHERMSAQERAFKENREYLLPARFDDTPVPGIRDTVGFVDLRTRSPEQFAQMIKEKVGHIPKFEYFPPEPTALFERFEISGDEDKADIYSAASKFFSIAKRMSYDERLVVFSIFLFGCPGALPENIHINLGYLARLTGLSQSKILRIMSDIKCLWFDYELRTDDETEGSLGKKEMLDLKWFDYGFEWSDEEDGNATIIVNELVDVIQNHYCEDHAIESLCNLDFSPLANSLEE